MSETAVLSPATPETIRAQLLAGYEHKKTVAAALKKSPRTIDRYCDAGMPFTMFGNEKYINIAGARAWIESQERNRKPKRRA